MNWLTTVSKALNGRTKSSAKKIENGNLILHDFNLDIPTGEAAKDLGFSYPMVSILYMQYCQEIVKILDQDFR